MATITTLEDQIEAALFGEQFNYASREEALAETLAAAGARIALQARQMAEMREVTGPKCPKCGHWLKAEHTRHYRGGSSNVYGDFFCEPCSEGLQRGISHCEIGLVDLITNHPLIAAELGLMAESQ